MYRKKAVIAIPSPLTDPSLSNVTELLTKRNDDARHRAILTLINSSITHSIVQTRTGLKEDNKSASKSVIEIPCLWVLLVS